MAEKITNIKERCLQFAEYKGVAKEKFFAQIGMSYGSFKGESKKTALNSDAIERILTIYPDVSPEWLVTGKGEMILPPQVSEKVIPFVDPVAIGGLGAAHFSIAEKDVKDFYVIPKFQTKKVDFMLEIDGVSMFPRYQAGDIVACMKITEPRFIQWNKTHVIATRDQGLIIKKLLPAENDNCYLMVSENPEYPPFEVPKDEITGIALVVGLVRVE